MSAASEHLNPYVNYHRPCLFPDPITDARDQQQRTLMTPYEKFKSLPMATIYLKPGITFEILDTIVIR